MSLNRRSREGFTLPFTVAWLALAALPFSDAPGSRAREPGPQDFMGTYAGHRILAASRYLTRKCPTETGTRPRVASMPVPGRQSPGRLAAPRSRTPRIRLIRPRKVPRMHPRPRKPGPRQSGSTATGISFRNDVAPILVANCVGCHGQGRPGLTRGKLDLTSFARLMQGTPKEKVIEPGKPDESHLVLRVKGEETPQMPQGGNNNGLSGAAIGKIEQWIKAGASLDAGLDPKAAMETYASSPEQVRATSSPGMSPKDRDRKVEAAGRDRWKQTNPKLTPEILSGEHFVLFSNLPKDRAANVIKVAESQHIQLKRLLGRAGDRLGRESQPLCFQQSTRTSSSLPGRSKTAKSMPAVSSTGSLTAQNRISRSLIRWRERRKSRPPPGEGLAAGAGEEKEAPAASIDRTLLPVC